MTWVIGMPNLLNGAAAIADICVTVRSGGRTRTLEGVQKIHYVGPWMVLGFAGSIELGFRAVNDLRLRLSGIPDDHMAYPGFTAWHWGRRLRYTYTHRLPEEVKRGGLELLLLGASPPCGGPVQTHGYILRAPDFIPQAIPSMRATSIGSGSSIPEYTAVLEGLFATLKDSYEILQFETHFVGGSLMPLAMVITEAIERRREQSVSEHLHLCFVRPGQVSLGTNDIEGLTVGAPSRCVPWVATNLAEFRALAAREGFASYESFA